MTENAGSAAATVSAARIDRAISPAGIIRSAACFSMFATSEGLYMVRTGMGWKLNYSGTGYRSFIPGMVNVFTAYRMVVEAELDIGDLATEVAARKGSVFIARHELGDVVLGSRRDGSPDLQFRGAATKYRVQFDEARRAEVEVFVGALAAAGQPETDVLRTIWHDGTFFEAVELATPCWGATPYVAVNDGRLFVQYVDKERASSIEHFVTYRSTDEDQALFFAGELDVPALCQLLVFNAWGSMPPLTSEM